MYGARRLRVGLVHLFSLSWVCLDAVGLRERRLRLSFFSSVLPSDNVNSTRIDLHDGGVLFFFFFFSSCHRGFGIGEVQADSRFHSTECDSLIITG